METDKIIQRIAFAMFRDWTKEVLKKFPAINLTIIDEGELVRDTKETIREALNSLFSPEYNENRKSKGWCIGFIIGYINGSLSRHWFYQYVQKQTETYKHFIAVKSILEYMRIDTNIHWILDAMYEQMLISENNLSVLELKAEIDSKFLNDYSICPKTSDRHLVARALDSLSVELIKELSQGKAIRMPDSDYLSREEILSFIADYNNSQRQN